MPAHSPNDSAPAAAAPAGDLGDDVVTVGPDVETVSCDGGGGALGHPLTYYNFGAGNVVMCGYCGRRFVRAASAH